MPAKPIQFKTCFSNASEFRFITTDQINHIRRMIIYIDRFRWYYTITKSMSEWANYCTLRNSSS